MSTEKPESAVSRQIDDSLRRVYQQTMEEEIPQRFQELLDRLKEGDKSGR